MLGEADSNGTVIVASEPLSEEPGWQEIPSKHVILIDSDRRFDIRAIH
jgi:predicted glutamine amidotransferase